MAEINVDLTGPQHVIIARCKECEHAWPLVYLPMEITKAARLMQHAFCPACGAGAPVVGGAEALEEWRAGKHDKGLR